MNLDKAAAFIKRQLASGALTHDDLARVVERAQQAMGLDADGMPGPHTLNRLDRTVVIEDDETLPEIAAPPPSSRAARTLARAHSVVGQGRYHLGSGGKDPGASTPFDKDGTSDCSGFVCWALELPRKDPTTSVWRNTDQLEADARGQVRGDIGVGVAWQDAQPGDVVVYGAGPAIGHTGIVSRVGTDGPTAVIHCRSGSPPAVVETGADLFRRKGAVILRPR